MEQLRQQQLEIHQQAGQQTEQRMEPWERQSPKGGGQYSSSTGGNSGSWNVAADGSPVSLRPGVARVTNSTGANGTAAAAYARVGEGKGFSVSSPGAEEGESGITRSYRLDTLVLPGTHITPCGGDVTWEVGPVYTPADALLQAAKAGSQSELRQLGARLVSWLDANTPRRGRANVSGARAGVAAAAAGSRV
jgi:hypothetical protein